MMLRSSSVLLPLLSLLTACTGSPTAFDADPDGPVALTEATAPRLEPTDQRIVPHGTTFAGRHAAQGLDATFDAAGAVFGTNGAPFALTTRGPTPGTPRLLDCHPLTGCGGTVEWDRGEVVETWSAVADGFEHAFEIASGGDALVLRVAVDGASVTLVDDASALLTDGAGTAWRYDGLAAWDAAGTPLEAWFAVETGGLAIHVDTTGAAWPVIVDPLLSSADWVGEPNKAGTHYGTSLAWVGDVNGDTYEDFCVGAMDYGNGQTSEGRIYAFYGSSGGFASTASWKVESNQSLAYLGNAVTGLGDVNGDGYDDVAVGAYRYDAGSTDEGVLQVFYGSPTGLPSTPSVTLEGNQASAYFGWSVAGGDFNGDGYGDAAVGAFKYDSGQTDEGLVFVYYGASSGLATTAATTLQVNKTNGWFGYALATGSLNGDTYADLLVGAPQYSNGETKEGRAYLYLGASGGLSAGKAWMVESNQANAYLGNALTFGDFDGDGNEDAAVGAYLWDGTVTDEGAVMVYEGTGTTLSSSPGWTLQEGQSWAGFGWVLAAGSLNGDAMDELLVGARTWDGTETDEGAVYGYDFATSTPVRGWEILSAQANAKAGYALAIAPASGTTAVAYAVAAPWWDNGSLNEGAVWIFEATPGDGDRDGYTTATDCDDLDASIHPGAAEICDGIDQDCDLVVDDGAFPTWYVDGDADGWGDAAWSGSSCTQPSGTATVDGDCDDADDTVHPGASDACNRDDDDCDAVVDEGAVCETEILALVNALRTSGITCYDGYYPPVGALASHADLTEAAQVHSDDMATHDFFSHTGSDGSDVGIRVDRTGYYWYDVGENLAGGYTLPSEVVDGWLASTAGHCGGMMGAGFIHGGLGVTTNPAAGMVHYWTLVMATDL